MAAARQQFVEQQQPVLRHAGAGLGVLPVQRAGRVQGRRGGLLLVAAPRRARPGGPSCARRTPRARFTAVGRAADSASAASSTSNRRAAASATP